MGVLDSVLAYKAKKDAEARADIDAIPLGINVFVAAKQQAIENNQKSLLMQIEAGKSGYKINNGTLEVDKSSPTYQKSALEQLQKSQEMQLNERKTMGGLGYNQTNKQSLLNETPKDRMNLLKERQTGVVSGKTYVKDPTLGKQVQIGQDENGNPIYSSAAQARYNVSSDRAEQAQWQKLIEKNDPSIVSSRSTLGMASNANLRANRALTLLDSPTTTKQDLGLVVEDLGGIMMGGVPTDQGMSLTDYNTLVSKFQAVKQYLSGVPEGAIPPKIKDKLRDTLTDLKKLDYDFINNHLNIQEAAQRKLIQKRPEDWKAFREKIMFDPYQSKSSSTTNRPSASQIAEAKSKGFTHWSPTKGFTK